MSAEPKAPYWDPNLPRWTVQDIDRYVKNGIQNYGDVMRAVNSVGGVDAYRRMASNFEKADALYQIEHAKWQIDQAKARGSNATSGNERWLSRYYEKAANTSEFSDQERASFAQQAEETKKQAAANKIIEDRNAMLRTAADKVQSRLLNEIWPARNAEYDRIFAETDALRKQVDAAYNNDIEQARKLYSAGMMAPAEYKGLTEKLKSNYSSARDQLTAQYKQARAAVSQIADQQSNYVDSLVADIQKGNYDPEIEYKLPDFGYKPISISASYTPVYAAQPKEEEVKQPQQPAPAPVSKPGESTQTPTTPAAPGATTPAAPSTPTGSTTTPAGNQAPQPSSPGQTTSPSPPPPPEKLDVPSSPRTVRAPNRSSNDLVGRARVVEQGGMNQQLVTPQAQTPGLISGADSLKFAPAANLVPTVGGLISTQNPQLYAINQQQIRPFGQI